MGRILGIDLGTTNSVVAIVDGPAPRVLDNREARALTRSVVGLKRRRGKPSSDSEILVGDPAVDNLPMAPADTIVSVKRLMGRGFSDPEVQRLRRTAQYRIVEPSDGTQDSVRVVMGGREYSPVDVSAMILAKLKGDAELRLGEPVTHAVVTVPAYFTQIQRAATRQACLKAGLQVIKILEEPTAAAIAFGVEAGDGTPKTVLVYDLGGGTFDISILMWAGNVFAPLNLEGDMWLGGDNLDDVLIEHATRHVQEEFGIDPTGNARFMAELKRAAQAVKERLSAAASADLLVTGLLQDDGGNLIDVELEITRADYERMILPLVGRFRRCSCGLANYPGDRRCARCAQPLDSVPIEDGRAVQLVRKALQHPNVTMTPDQIDYVIMAGNATSAPLVQDTLGELFGAGKILRRMHPKHSVAIGAAIVGSWHGPQLVCQCPDPADPRRECGHINTEGARACAKCGAAIAVPAAGDLPPTERMGQIGGIAPVYYGAQTVGDQFNVFVEKGEPFPTTEPRAQIFRTVVPKQRMISIPIYGGDDMTRASANERQGEAFAVLPPDLPQRTPVRVKLWLDADGVFVLTAHLDDGTDLKPWIVKGELDAKVIRGVERVEKLLAGPEPRTEDKAHLERGRHAVLELLRAHDFQGAAQEIQRIEQVLIDMPTVARTPALRSRVDATISWVDYVLQQYGWALPSSFASRLQALAQQVRMVAPRIDDDKLAAEFASLDALCDQLPDPVYSFLAIRNLIRSRIRPGDPVLAGQMAARIENVEHAFRTGRESAPGDLRALIEDMNEAALQHGNKTVLRCSSGHDVPPGERLCPACGEDTWGLQGNASPHSAHFKKTM